MPTLSINNGNLQSVQVTMTGPVNPILSQLTLVMHNAQQAIKLTNRLMGHLDGYLIDEGTPIDVDIKTDGQTVTITGNAARAMNIIYTRALLPQQTSQAILKWLLNSPTSNNLSEIADQKSTWDDLKALGAMSESYKQQNVSTTPGSPTSGSPYFFQTVVDTTVPTLPPTPATSPPIPVY